MENAKKGFPFLLKIKVFRYFLSVLFFSRFLHLYVKFYSKAIFLTYSWIHENSSFSFHYFNEGYLSILYFWQVPVVPRKWFGSADCDTIYLCTQTADPNSFRGSHCCGGIPGNTQSLTINIFLCLDNLYVFLLFWLYNDVVCYEAEMFFYVRVSRYIL